jgi:hypothetical protein
LGERLRELLSISIALLISVMLSVLLGDGCLLSTAKPRGAL